MDFDFLVLEEFEVKRNKDQALVHFKRDYELHLEDYCIVLEEARDLTFTKTTNGGCCESISLMDEYCKELVHISSPHTSISATSCGDEK